MLRKGLGVLILLALPFISFSWDCNTDLLDVSFFCGDDLRCHCSYISSGFFYYCLFVDGNVSCQKETDTDVFPLDFSDPLDYRFYGSCLFRANQCGCSCDFSSGDGSSGDGSLGGGSSGGSPPVNLCSDLDEFNNLLLGIKQGLLKIFLASAFLVGLASASATVMRVKGWI
ncbi:hypothetical protein [Pampinifervens florentissimum]|uniref:hypothetical protein n=1 Tax=Pampinifervens florentissimum TaxID=1632019 RepID=UPI0013B494DC|nr:hypothetical protein [Hydrogenobacter sp. T-8]QID34112.1 hypothetical protein G3M65_10135 [Hydrogenobacter sp. T-8]